MNIFSNIPPQRNSNELYKHFSATYFALRGGLALLSIAMPFVLYLYGKHRHGLDLQPSMSAYFWAAAANHCATFPMRTIFVGFLFAVGVGLYAYKGLTPLENTVLNLAAVCAVMVAIYPENLWDGKSPVDPKIEKLFATCPAIRDWATIDHLPIHLIAAVSLFILLAIVAWFCANKSLEYLPAGHDAAKFRAIYKCLAVAMILFPIPGLALAYMFGVPSSIVFFIEAAGIFTFGIYWVVKSRELALSRLERNPEQSIKSSD